MNINNIFQKNIKKIEKKQLSNESYLRKRIFSQNQEANKVLPVFEKRKTNSSPASFDRVKNQPDIKFPNNFVQPEPSKAENNPAPRKFSDIIKSESDIITFNLIQINSKLLQLSSLVGSNFSNSMKDLIEEAIKSSNKIKDKSSGVTVL